MNVGLIVLAEDVHMLDFKHIPVRKDSEIAPQTEEMLYPRFRTLKMWETGLMQKQSNGQFLKDSLELVNTMGVVIVNCGLHVDSSTL